MALPRNPLNFLFRPWSPVERVTSGVPVIETNHANIHEGRAFELSGTLAVSAGQIGAVKIPVPEGAYIHFQAADFTADGGPVTAKLIEDATFTDASEVSKTPVCLHRINPPSSIVAATVYGNVTVQNGDSPLTVRELYIPANVQGSQRLSWHNGTPNEVILQSGVNYLVTIANGGSSTVNIGYYLFWYEESAA